MKKPRTYRKSAFPVSDVRRFLEPGPIVLVSSAWKGRPNIMTMGWHMIMETGPSRIGCYIWTENYSGELITKSKECVINVPTAELAATVVKIGNSCGRDIDKFSSFGLTPVAGTKVSAPLIAECHSSFECRVVDTSQVKKYSLFVLECVAAHVAKTPAFPQTIHYRGAGLFMIAGKTTAAYKKLFDPSML